MYYIKINDKKNDCLDCSSLMLSTTCARVCAFVCVCFLTFIMSSTVKVGSVDNLKLQSHQIHNNSHHYDQQHR